MAASVYRKKIKKIRNTILYVPFNPECYTDYFLRKNHKLKINS